MIFFSIIIHELANIGGQLILVVIGHLLAMSEVVLKNFETVFICILLTFGTSMLFDQSTIILYQPDIFTTEAEA